MVLEADFVENILFRAIPIGSLVFHCSLPFSEHDKKVQPLEPYHLKFRRLRDLYNKFCFFDATEGVAEKNCFRKNLHDLTSSFSFASASNKVGSLNDSSSTESSSKSGSNLGRGGNDKNNDKGDSIDRLTGFKLRYPVNFWIDSFLDGCKKRFVSFCIFCNCYKFFFDDNKRQKIVVVGGGWGALSLLSRLDVTKYDISVVTPQSSFSFTPMLTSVISGAILPRSATEPIRSFLYRGRKQVMKMYSGQAVDIDVAKNQLKVESVCDERRTFNIDYDFLFVTVGLQANTQMFSAEKVHKNGNLAGETAVLDDTECCMKNVFKLKDIDDAKVIKNAILDKFEAASVPNISESERFRLLHFVILGGNTTGVEIAADMKDLVDSVVKKGYPELKDYVKITVLESTNSLLSSLKTESLSVFCRKHFEEKLHINCMFLSKVVQILPKKLIYETEDKETKSVEYGMAIAAVGLKTTEFAEILRNKITDQPKSTSFLAVDEQLQLIGTNNIYCVGDACKIKPKRLSENTTLLYELLNQYKSYASSYDLSKNYQPNSEQAINFFLKHQNHLSLYYPQYSKEKCNFKIPKLHQDPVKALESKEALESFLKAIDDAYISPPSNAQFALQQGEYLASMFNRFSYNLKSAPAFVENFKGFLVYVGGDQAVGVLPGMSIPGGYHTAILWKAVYLMQQKSFRNRLSLLFDWTLSTILGNDISRV